MDLLSPVVKCDSHVALREVCHLFSSIISPSCIPPLEKSYRMCESLCHSCFRFGVFYSITMGFFSEKFPCAGYP